jgi:hypothetical protein
MIHLKLHKKLAISYSQIHKIEYENRLSDRSHYQKCSDLFKTFDHVTVLLMASEYPTLTKVKFKSK